MKQWNKLSSMSVCLSCMFVCPSCVFVCPSSDNTDSTFGPSSTKVHRLTRTKWLGPATWHMGARLFTATSQQCTSHVTSTVLAHWLLHLEMSVQCPLSSLHVSDRQGWWWPRLAGKTTAGDGMLMLWAAGVSVVLYVSK